MLLLSSSVAVYGQAMSFMGLVVLLFPHQRFTVKRAFLNFLNAVGFAVHGAGQRAAVGFQGNDALLLATGNFDDEILAINGVGNIRHDKFLRTFV